MQFCKMPEYLTQPGYDSAFLTSLIDVVPFPPFSAEVCVSGRNPGLAGAPLDRRECPELTETFLRTPPGCLGLSPPALAFDSDRLIPVFLVIEVGVAGGGVPPFCTSCTVFSSAAVPRMPIKK